MTEQECDNIVWPVFCKRWGHWAQNMGDEAKQDIWITLERFDCADILKAAQDLHIAQPQLFNPNLLSIAERCQAAVADRRRRQQAACRRRDSQNDRPMTAVELEKINNLRRRWGWMPWRRSRLEKKKDFIRNFVKENENEQSAGQADGVSGT